MGLRYVILFLSALLLIPPISADLYFTEIMYNPSDHEWVEIFSNESLNITDCKLQETYNRSLILYMGNNSCLGYCIIAADPLKFLSLYPGEYNLFSTDKLFQLSNNGEKLALVCNGILKDNMTYADSAVDGESLQFYNGTWISGNATPGAAYIAPEPVLNNDTDANLTNSTSNTTVPFAPAQSASTDNSSIKIDKIYLDQYNKTGFGKALDVKFTAYRGSTNKYAVYIELVGISEKTQANFYDKQTGYTVMLPIQIKPNCNKRYADKEYTLRISGLNLIVEKNITVAGINPDLCKTIETTKVVEKIVEKTTECDEPSSSSSARFEYEIVDYPDELESGESFTIKVRLKNNYYNEMPIKIWSYVYRGSRSYSGERELNLKNAVLSKGEEKVITLTNTLDEVESGEYNLKVKINKNNEKTDKELTETMTVTGGVEQTKEKAVKCPVCDCKNPVPVAEMVMAGVKTTTNSQKEIIQTEPDSVVYQSDNSAQKKAAPILLSVAGLLMVGLFRLPKANS